MKPVDLATVNALSAPHVVLVLFLQFDVTIDATTTTVRYCSAGHDIVWDGHTWLGVGYIMSIDPIREVGLVEAVGLKVTLSGVPSTLLATALLAHVVGRPAKVYIGAYDSNGALVSTPWLEFEGRMDNMTIEDSQADSKIVLSIESRLATLMGAEGRLWTHAEQLKLDPTDNGLKFIGIAAERTMKFGPGR